MSLAGPSQAIRQVADWFQGPYRSPNGFPWALVHGETGEALGEKELSSEADDYLGLLRMAGYPDYADGQVRLLGELLDAHPEGLYHRPQMRAEAGVRFRLPGLPSPRYFDILDLTEILFGLLDSHGAGGRVGELELACRFAGYALRHFLRKGELRSWRWLTPGWTLPVLEPLSGMIVEALCDLARITGQEAWLEPARSTARRWVEDPSFQRWGAFRSVRVTGPLVGWLDGRFGASRRFELVKTNTSMAWALLALHQIDGDPLWAESLDRWLQGLDEVFSGEGPLCSQLGGPPGRPRPSLVLSTNFAVIDVLCDLAAAGERWRSLLDRAGAMADAWVELRFPETGLLPDHPGEPRSYVDANTDLAVSLLRLAELTGRETFRHEAERTIQAVLEHHAAPQGLYRDVDGRTGEPLSPLVETRFVSLFLKPLLILRDGMRLYGPDGSAHLMRDR